jgi:hypothetical protein
MSVARGVGQNGAVVSQGVRVGVMGCPKVVVEPAMKGGVTRRVMSGDRSKSLGVARGVREEEKK